MAFSIKICLLHVILAQIILLYFKNVLTLHSEFFILTIVSNEKSFFDNLCGISLSDSHRPGESLYREDSWGQAESANGVGWRFHP
jgi:hypothetical protein